MTVIKFTFILIFLGLFASTNVFAGERCYHVNTVDGPYTDVSVSDVSFDVSLFRSSGNTYRQVVFDRTIRTWSRTCTAFTKTVKKRVCDKNKQCREREYPKTYLEYVTSSHSTHGGSYNGEIDLSYSGLDLLNGESAGNLRVRVSYDEHSGTMSASTNSTVGHHYVHLSDYQQGRTLEVSISLTRGASTPNSGHIGVKIINKDSAAQTMTVELTDYLKQQNPNVKLGKTQVNFAFYRHKVFKDKKAGTLVVDMGNRAKKTVVIKWLKTKRGKFANRFKYSIRRQGSSYHNEKNSKITKKRKL